MSERPRRTDRAAWEEEEDSAALRIRRKRRDEKEKKDKKGWIPVGRPGRLPRPDGRNAEPTGELGNTARVLPGPDSARRT